MAKKSTASKPASRRSKHPTAEEMLAEVDHPVTAIGGNAGPPKAGIVIAAAFEPEDGDAPVGGLTDAQLGNRIRLICARGYGAFVFPHAGQIYLRVIRPD